MRLTRLGRLALGMAILAVFSLMALPALAGIQVAQGVFLDAGFAVINTADNTAGNAHLVMTQLNPSLPKSGTGSLIVIKFRGKQVGASSTLTLVNPQLARRDGFMIPATGAAGQVEVIASGGPTPTSLPTQGAGTPMAEATPEAPTATQPAAATSEPTAPSSTTTPEPSAVSPTATPQPTDVPATATAAVGSPTTAPTSLPAAAATGLPSQTPVPAASLAATVALANATAQPQAIAVVATNAPSPIAVAASATPETTATPVAQAQPDETEPGEERPGSLAANFDRWVAMTAGAAVLAAVLFGWFRRGRSRTDG